MKKLLFVLVGIVVAAAVVLKINSDRARAEAQLWAEATDPADN